MELFAQSKIWTGIVDLFNKWTTPVGITRDSGLRYLQERVVLTILFTGLVLGLFAYIPSVRLCIKEQLWGVAFFDTAIYAMVFVLLFFRRIPFVVRANAIIFSSFLLGLVLITIVGPSASGPVWLFTFPVLAGVIIGARTSVYALILNLIALIVIGGLIYLDYPAWMNPPPPTLERWIVITLNFILLNVIAAMSLAMVLKGRQSSLDHEKTLRLSLEHQIDERKHAEQNLRESEIQYRLLADNVFDLIWTMDLEQRFTYVSPSIQKLLGYTPEETLQIPLKNMFTPESYEKVVSTMIKEIAGKGKPMDSPDGYRVYELEHIRKNGGKVWGEVTTSFLRNEDGLPSGVIGVTRDISERKKAEAVQRLNESRLEALLAINQMTDAPLDEIMSFVLENGVTLTSSEIGYIAFVDKDETLLTMHSWSEAAMEKCKTTDKPLTYPVCDTGLWGEAVRQRKPVVTNDYAAFNPLKKGCPEGHINIIRHMNIPLFEGSRIVAVAGVGNKTTDYDHTDIRQLTLIMQGMWQLIQRKRAHEEKKELEYQLQQAQKMEAIGTLAGGIAHDFNNILSAILGYTELALDETDNETLLYDNLIEVLSAGNRAKDLVKQILTLSRHDSVEFKPVHIVALVKEAFKMLRATIPTSIEIQETICSDRFIVYADSTQIHQVIVNLATNAKHAMIDANGVLSVCVEPFTLDEGLKSDDSRISKGIDAVPGNYVRITISDTGSGIDKAHLDKIFEPYFTTKAVGEGTGLGLSVVHGIVKSHKGDISVSSEPGKGTTFQVYLPLAKQHSDELPSHFAEQIFGGTERILLVDDELPIVKMLQQTLERMGYTVTIRVSSIEALEAFRSSSETFDLVITDMTMPNMTGDTLAEEIKKIRKDIPVILCTGFSEKINIQAEPYLQINGFLMKPVNKVELAKIVRDLLDAG